MVNGLDYLHSRGFVHRDFKSPNVLLTSLFEPKLCDFGLARLQSTATATVNRAVSARWAAPEVLLSERVTAKCDIWSLGVVLLEILTGALPWAGKQDAQIITSVVVKRLKPSSGACVSCPPRVLDMVNRCLSYEPQARPELSEIRQMLLS